MVENKKTTVKKATNPKAPAKKAADAKRDVAKRADTTESKVKTAAVKTEKAPAAKKPAPKKAVVDGKEAQACGKLIRTSPRKLGLVAGLIRGKKADKALVDLTFSKKRVSELVKKVLQSAIANAENNHNMDIDKLYVSEAHVGKAITMKRFHARAKGRGNQIKKMFSNITIVVREYEEKI